MNIFDKIGIQAVILRCCTGLEPYWFKSYDKNAKNVKTQKTLDKLGVFYKIEKYFALKITDFLHLEDVKIPY